MTEQFSIEQEYAAALAASVNYKRRAEAAEAALQAVMTRAESSEVARDAQFETNVRLLQENIELRARAEQLEASTAQLESEKRAVEFQSNVLRNERDEARLELQQIRTMLDSGMDETAIDMVKRLHTESYELRRHLADLRMSIVNNASA